MPPDYDLLLLRLLALCRELGIGMTQFDSTEIIYGKKVRENNEIADSGSTPPTEPEKPRTKRRAKA